MSKFHAAILTIAVLFASFPALGDRIAITDDGRRVLLKDDGTWLFEDATPQDDLPPVVLIRITRVEDGRLGCWIEMEATNVTEERLRGFEPSIMFSGSAPAWKRDVGFRFPALVPQSSLIINRTIRDEPCANIGDGRIVAINGDCRNGQQTLPGEECLARTRIQPTDQSIKVTK
ncbi:MAG: hypothetical protein RJQ21_12220 [Rhodospirillales bacterium]